MRKKLLAALLALACIVLPTQFANAATDYSTVRVRLSSSLDDLNIGVNGLYLLPEGNLTVTSDINVRLDSSKTALVVTQNGAQIYSGSSFQLIRSADQGGRSGLLRMYNRQHGWRYYLGDMKFTINAKGEVQVVNTIGMEEYLIGVVAYEMNNTWPLETLKSQAVAARSYVACKLSPKASYDVVDTASDQVYKGYDASNTNVIAAVQATAGEVLMSSSGAIVMGYYAASNGGQTELISNAWGSDPSPYYPIKDDPYDLRNANTPLQKFLLPRAVSSATPLDSTLESYLKSLAAPKLAALGYTGFTDEFSIVGISAATGTNAKYSAPSRCYQNAAVTLLISPTGQSAGGGAVSGNVPQFTLLDGSNGTLYIYVNENRVVTAEEKALLEAAYYQSAGGAAPSGTVSVDVSLDFATLKNANEPYRIFTNDSLRMYYVEEAAEGFYLVNARYGHGIGLSQRGAQQMGLEGWNYRDILNFYYSNIIIGQISTSTSTLPDGNITVEPDDLVVESALPNPGAVYGAAAAKVTLRKTPSSSGKSLGSLAKGTGLSIAAQNGDWMHVITEDGAAGYLPREYVKLDLDGDVLLLVTGNASMTASQGSAGTTVATLTAGDSVQLLAASGDDYLVTDGSQTGYLPQSKACLIIGEISFVTSSDHRYAQATADTPFYTTKTKSKTHGTIPAGDVVEITTQVKGGELYNAVYGGNTGCVLQDSVTLVRKGGVHPNPGQLLAQSGSFSGTTRYVNTAGLNVRSAPNASSSVLKVLSSGNAVTVLDTINGWNKIQCQGITGYVNAAYLSSSKPGGETSSDSEGGETDASAANTSTGDVSTATGKVNASSLNIRAKASTSSDKVGTVSKGATVSILASSGDWYRIQSGSVAGYVKKEYVTLQAYPTGTVNASSLNVRSSPSTTASAVGKLQRGESVTITHTSGDWYKIKGGGITGYVKQEYIASTLGSTVSKPTAEPEDGEEETSAGADAPATDKPSGSAVATGVINTSNVNMRAKPSTSSDVVGSLSKNTTVDIYASSGDWYRIGLSGVYGYVKKDYVGSIKSAGSTGTSTKSPLSSYTKGIVTASELQVRASASTSGKKLFKLQKGDIVDILSKSGDFYKVKHPSGTGYVAKKYIDGVSSVGIVYNVKEYVTMRAKPSTSSDALAKLPKGVMVRVLDDQGDWIKVQYQGTTGYVSSKYIGQ